MDVIDAVVLVELLSWDLNESIAFDGREELLLRCVGVHEVVPP